MQRFIWLCKTALANDEDLVRFFDDFLFPQLSALLRRRREEDIDVGEKMVIRNKAESFAPSRPQYSKESTKAF